MYERKQGADFNKIKMTNLGAATVTLTGGYIENDEASGPVGIGVVTRSVKGGTPYLGGKDDSCLIF